MLLKLKTLFAIVFTALFFTGCTKEYSYEGTPPNVASSTGIAVFTLAGAPSSCTGVVVSGIYSAGIPTNNADSAIVAVNVDSTGSYVISTNTENGVSFNAAGTFTQTGPQQVTLKASGRSSANGAFTYAIGSNGCSFTILAKDTTTAIDTIAAAVYTLTGAPNACMAPTVAGTYTSGTALNSSNTVTFSVNVTTAGSYTIASNTVNGISFSGSGTFTSTGPKTVILTGSGTPINSGTSALAIAGANCSINVSVALGAAPATFTLNGGPGNCSGFTLNGTYTAGSALTSANTAVTQVNVTSIGAYNISTAVVNGISFSASGSFTATGVQSVILNGIGTPVNAGANNFTISAANSTCTFSVTTVAGVVVTAPTNYITCTINGVAETFNNFDTTTVLAGVYAMSGNGTNPLQLSFGPEFLNGGTLAIASYVNTVAALTTDFYSVGFDYTDASGNIWAPAGAAGAAFGGGTIDPFTITITNVTATRVVGTFSGTIRSNVGTGNTTMSVTSGKFSVPNQY